MSRTSIVPTAIVRRPPYERWLMRLGGLALHIAIAVIWELMHVMAFFGIGGGAF